MELIYNKIDNTDQNSIFYPIYDTRYIKNNVVRREDLNELDNYYKLLCEIIDECSSLLLTNKNNIIDKFKDNLKYEVIDTENIKAYYKKNNYLFDIIDIKSKEYVKNNLTIKLLNTKENIDINKPFLEKEDEVTKLDYVLFLKGKNVAYSLQRLGGKIKCYNEFNERKNKNIPKLNIESDTNIFNSKGIFTCSEILEEKDKLKKYLDNRYKEFKYLDSVIVKNNNSKILKKHDGYFYSDIYINDKIVSKNSFITGYYIDKKELLNNIYEALVNDIKNNRDNVYYFKEYENYSKQYISLILEIKDNKIKEIKSNKESIKIKTYEYETNRRVGEILELTEDSNTIEKADVDIDVNHFYNHYFTKEDMTLVDKYYEKICKIVDKCTVMIILNDNNYIKRFTTILKFKHYNYIDTLNLSSYEDAYVFDIKDLHSKELVKKNISYNLYDNMMYEDYPSSAIYKEVKRPFIANDGTIDYNNSFIYFLIENNKEYALSRYSGTLYKYGKSNEKVLKLNKWR